MHGVIIEGITASGKTPYGAKTQTSCIILIIRNITGNQFA